MGTQSTKLNKKNQKQMKLREPQEVKNLENELEPEFSYFPKTKNENSSFRDKTSKHNIAQVYEIQKETTSAKTNKNIPKKQNILADREQQTILNSKDKTVLNFRMPTCPISLEPIQDPVIAADNQTYDRVSIENWLKNHDTSPLTNQKLSHKKLAPNYALCEMMQSVRENLNPQINQRKKQKKDDGHGFGYSTNLSKRISLEPESPLKPKQKQKQYQENGNQIKSKSSDQKILFKQTLQNELIYVENRQISHYGKYTGEISQFGLPSGKGKLIYLKEYTNYLSYEGEFINGIQQGYGILHYKNGDIYEGKFRESQRNGDGILKLRNGDKITGVWKDDRTNGQGIIQYSNGDRYEGMLYDRQYQGKGKFLKANQYTLQGNFNNSNIIGIGKITYHQKDQNNDSTSIVYEGEIDNHSQHGIGTCIWPNGQKYQGEWFNGKFQGEGTFFYKNGDFYKGRFKDNLREGRGTYFYSDGRIQKQEYYKDVLVLEKKNKE